MWETRRVELVVELPTDIAGQAEEVAVADPDFLSRVVLYGLTRRSIYRHLRDQEPRLNARGQELTDHEHRILAENPDR